MSRVIFPPKRVGETISLSVDFTPVTSQTISSCVVTASVISGVDANPAAMISGSAGVTAGHTVGQKITAGVSGVIYLLTWTATCADATIVIVTGYLAVLPASV